MAFAAHKQQSHQTQNKSNPQQSSLHSNTNNNNNNNSPQHSHPPNVKSPSSSAPISMTTSTSTSTSRNGQAMPIGHGPWLNYEYPSKWELSDDFMCVHFIPRTADKHTWSSQCIFWSEAISLYAQQLLYECPFKYNRLTFTAKDIKLAYTRKNRLTPMCIIDIVKYMKYHENNIEFQSFIDRNYCNKYISSSNISKIDANNNNNSSLLSISGVSSMVSSMFQYLVPNESDIDDDDESQIDIAEDTKIIYIPIMDELCERLCDINCYKKAIKSDLCELIEIGIINLNHNNIKYAENEFIINGLVFYRFCLEILKLTIFDIDLLKKYLIYIGKIKLFYLNDDDSLNSKTFTTEILNKLVTIQNFHDLKNEMIYFNMNTLSNDMEISHDQLTKMQLLSIQMTMKHLKFEKAENENNLNNINNELLNKLKCIPSSKRSQFMHSTSNLVLLKRKKMLKNRISSLDGSIYNLESTLHSMEDMEINKMVFNEMKNADKMLKKIIKCAPSIDEIHKIQNDIKESMEINEEIGNELSKPMDTDYDDIDDDELLKEYQDLEMENMNNILPEAPNHDIIIKDIENNDVDTEVIDKEKQILLQ